MKTSIELLDHQWEAIEAIDKHKFTLLCGGIGSGKTYLGSVWVLKMMKQYPKGLGLITANTYGQLKKSTLASLFANLTDFNISFEYNQMSSLLTVEGQKKFLCLSAETYDNHRGIEISDWWADEASFYKKEAFDVFTGRLRGKHGGLSVLLTTSPNSFNWLYSKFIKEGSDDPLYKTIFAKSRENKHLPNGYLDHLESSYSDKQIQQELEGRFVSISHGKVYYAFTRDVNVCDNVQLQRGTIFIGMDFNVGFMCATVLQFINDKIYVIDEVTLRDSDTFQMTHELKKRGYMGTVIPDATAIARKTSGMSDFEIIKQAGFQIKYTNNPYVIDRVNCMNKALRDQEIIISSKCKVLIADLEQVAWKGNKLDQTTNKDLTHVSDSLGYAVNLLKPIQVKSRAVYTRDR